MVMRTSSDARRSREVWAWNFRAEFFAFLEALHLASPGALVALDTEFPGCIRDGPWTASRKTQHEALRCNVDLMRPLQLGLAVATRDGEVLGVWSFNLHFDLAKDLHTESSIAFLQAAGIEFWRHAAEGIDADVLGKLLVVGVREYLPCWITFAGLYDLAYLVKLVTCAPLPRGLEAFDELLEHLCPLRLEVRDWLPHGSLESLVQQQGLRRHGAAHTAASDALATLDLFVKTAPREVWSRKASCELCIEENSDISGKQFSEITEAVAPAKAPAETVVHTAGTHPQPQTSSSSWGSSARLSACSTKSPRRLQTTAPPAPPAAASAARVAELWAASARAAAVDVSLVGIRGSCMRPRPLRAS